jgi:RNA polymerase sigma-70 factor (ECF subfamily)
MAARPGLVVSERSVGSQSGLVLSRDGQTTAAMTVDFTGRLISVVWIKLHPVLSSP